MCVCKWSVCGISLFSSVVCMCACTCDLGVHVEYGVHMCLHMYTTWVLVVLQPLSKFLYVLVSLNAILDQGAR